MRVKDFCKDTTRQKLKPSVTVKSEVAHLLDQCVRL